MPPRPDLGPKPRLGYTHSRIERAAELRLDKAAVARLAAQPGAGAYVIGGDWIAMKKGAPLNDPLFTMDEARALGAASDTVFLGLLDGVARFGYGISPATAEAMKTRDGLLVTALRSIAVQGLVEPEHLPRRADANRACRLAARLRGLQGRAFPAHRSGGDHAGDRRRALPTRPVPTVRADHVVVPGRFHRAGRSDRGRGAPRNARGSRHQLRPRGLFPLATVAVPDHADDRLPCRGVDLRNCGRPRGTRGRAVV